MPIRDEDKRREYMKAYQRRMLANSKFAEAMYDGDVDATEEALAKAHAGELPDVRSVPMNELSDVMTAFILSTGPELLALALDFRARYGGLDVTARISETADIFKDLAKAQSYQERADLASKVCEYIEKNFMFALHNEHFPEENREKTKHLLEVVRHMHDLLITAHQFKVKAMTKNKDTGLV